MSMLYRYGIHLLTLFYLGISMLYKYGTNLDNKVEIAVGFGFGHNWAYEQEFVHFLFSIYCWKRLYGVITNNYVSCFLINRIKY